MGPMLEHPAATVVQDMQVSRAIGRAAGVKDHVMRARHGVDRVNLDEPQTINHILEVRAIARTGWRLAKPMAM